MAFEMNGLGNVGPRPLGTGRPMGNVRHPNGNVRPMGNMTNLGPCPVGNVQPPMSNMNNLGPRPVGNVRPPMSNLGPRPVGNNFRPAMGNNGNAGPRPVGNISNVGARPTGNFRPAMGNNGNVGPRPVGNISNVGPRPMGNFRPAMGNNGNVGPRPVGNISNVGPRPMGNFRPAMGNGNVGPRPSGNVRPAMSGNVQANGFLYKCGLCEGVSKVQYQSECRHLTLCLPCGKAAAESGRECPQENCNMPLKKLLFEKILRKDASRAKQYHIGRFHGGVVPENLKKCKVGIRVEDGPLAGPEARAKPQLVLENPEGPQYQGKVSGNESHYAMCVKSGMVVPVTSCYNFEKTRSCNLLRPELHTSEEVEALVEKKDSLLKSSVLIQRKEEMEKKEKGEEMVKKEKGEEKTQKIKEEMPEGLDFEEDEEFSDDDERLGDDPMDAEPEPEVEPAEMVDMTDEDEENEDKEKVKEREDGLTDTGREMKKLLAGAEDKLKEWGNSNKAVAVKKETSTSKKQVAVPVPVPVKKETSTSKNRVAVNGKRRMEDEPGNLHKKCKVEETEPVTKEELNAAYSKFKREGPVHPKMLVETFKSRLTTAKTKNDFMIMLKNFWQTRCS